MTSEVKHPKVQIDDDLSTRDKIFFTAIYMFALNGYGVVSVKDIANAVGIKSASIYNHFASKDSILEEIIEFVNDTNTAYYARTRIAVEKASNFSEILDCLFKELEEVYDITIFYGVALLSAEQFQNDRANTALNDVYLGGGIEFMEETFTYCIKMGWVKPFDTKACAELVMNSVLTGSLIRVQEDMGRTSTYNSATMFSSIRKFLESTLQAAD